MIPLSSFHVASSYVYTRISVSQPVRFYKDDGTKGPKSKQEIPNTAINNTIETSKNVIQKKDSESLFAV